MDRTVFSQVKAGSWALENGVSVVVCNGKLEKAITGIVKGKNIGTFFTPAKGTNTPVEVEAAFGKIFRYCIATTVETQPM